MSNILKGLNESYFNRDEQDQQNAMDTRRRSDLSGERNAGLDEPDELPTTPQQSRNGVYEYNVPTGQEKIAQELGLQLHKGHWVSRIPIQRANFQFGRPQFHEIPAKNVSEAEQDYGPEYQDKVKRLGQMAKQGERKTVWDPIKRVYKTVPVNSPKEQGVAEGLDEAVGDNYLYHATQPSGMMRILRSGAIKASYRPQEATKARTQSPTVSTTRSKQYAESDDFVNFLNLTKEGNSVIIVFDRNAVANHYKMFSTSQGTQTVGDEFEEVIVVPKGAMPIQGTMKGFYFNPKRTAEIEEFKDTPWFKELLNSPYYMGQKQGVAEGYKEERLKGCKCQHRQGDNKKCPIHGVQEGVAEGERIKTPSGMYRDQHTGVAYRGKTGQDGNDSYMTPDYLIQKYQERLAQIASGPYKRPKEVAQLKSRIAKLQGQKQGVAEGVAETLPMDDAVKVLRQYGADHFKTTSNELHFYKQGRPFSVDLVMNPDATRSVTLSSLNSATRGLKGQGVAEEQLDELKCWSGYTRVQGVPAGAPGSCKKKTNEEDVAEATGDVKFDKMLKGITGKKEVAKQQKIDTKQQARDAFGGMFGGGNPADKLSIRKKGVAEGQEEKCPHCGGAMFSEMIMNEKKDACYYKVKSRYKVWPSAYASGALVKCRKSGADSWGDGGKKNESSILEGIEQVDENLNKWFKEKWVRFGPDGKIRGDCARGDDSEGKPKCLPQSKAQNLGKEGRASAAARKRREDPNPERSGKAINVNTKKKSNEGVAEGYQFKGPFPFDVDHMHGGRGINLPKAETKKYFTDKKQWEQAVNDINSSKYDDNSDYIGVTGRSTVEINGREWARWSDAQQKGYIELSSMSEQGVAEAQLDEKWSQKYKDSINCSNPKGFSQKAHCQGKTNDRF
jgi:hypothetical protein